MKRSISLKYSLLISLLLFFNNNIALSSDFTGSKTVVAYVQPNQGNPYFAYGTFGIDIGKKYVSEAQETETARTKFTFDLTSIPGNATINSVDLNYTISNYENGSYHFKMTQIGNYNSPQEIYQNIGQAAVLFSDVLYNSGSLNSGTLTSMVNSNKGSYLYIGAFSQNESSLDSWANLDLTLSVDYSVPPTSVDITAQNIFIYGTIRVGIDEDPTQQNSPFLLSPNVGQTVNLEAENQSYGGYERVWNNYAPNSPSDWWRNGAFFSNQLATNFTVTQSDDDATYQANLRKNYAISRNDQTEFDGTLPAGIVNYIVEQNSGTITAPGTKTIGNKTYNFAGWTDDFSQPNPRTVSPTDNESYEALYKYKQHSDDTDGYLNNSQNKFIQTPDGTKHIVYESMDKIWYEISTDGGSTWRLMNGCKPLNAGIAKKPSMDYHGNAVAIVFQENNAGFYNIKLSTFYAYGNDYVLGKIHW